MALSLGLNMEEFDVTAAYLHSDLEEVVFVKPPFGIIMKKPLIIFALFTSAYFLSYFYRLANAVISPDLTAELSLTAAQLGLTTSVFFATFAVINLFNFHQFLGRIEVKLNDVSHIGQSKPIEWCRAALSLV